MEDLDESLCQNYMGNLYKFNFWAESITCPNSLEEYYSNFNNNDLKKVQEKNEQKEFESKKEQMRFNTPVLKISTSKYGTNVELLSKLHYIGGGGN